MQIMVNPQLKIGILGDGQLAKFLAVKLHNFGAKVYIYGDNLDSPAMPLGHKRFLSSEYSLKQFFDECDKVCLESEFISYNELRDLELTTGTKVVPSVNDYNLLSTKINQKKLFQKLLIPMAKTIVIENENDLIALRSDNFFPGVLKRSYGGYDGYGNLEVLSESKLDGSYKELSQNGVIPCLFEEKLNIKNEFALMIVKSKEKSFVMPVCQTHQKKHICHLVEYPAKITESGSKCINEYGSKLLDSLEGPGIYAFEFFELSNGEIYINEAAPRPHNSYHFSMDAFDSCQFDILARLALDVPLKFPEVIHSNVCMVNLLGKSHSKNYRLQIPNTDEKIQVRPYLYNKLESRPGRKLGHLNVFGGDNARVAAEKIYEEYQL